MEIKKILQFKAFKGVACGVVGLVIILGAVAVGVRIGSHRAGFSRNNRSGKYQQSFNGFKGGNGFNSMGGRGMPFNRPNMRNSQGFNNGNITSGKIDKINGSALSIKDNSNTEVAIIIGSQTAITSQNNTIKLSDLKIGDTITVNGIKDSNGQIQAQSIRVFPINAPAASGSASPSSN